MTSDGDGVVRCDAIGTRYFFCELVRKIPNEFPVGIGTLHAYRASLLPATLISEE